eukprot:TRINITY_DN37030_c0_g1_i1.p1 TRINITY_DN37030_c0_g1~~TRINITY_DN37030_c0_g1_i1.p1  ORF type:complete len:496 (+),score=114.05 TRINITY_DN37030_c0_g1_i1:25-1488(+)
MPPVTALYSAIDGGLLLQLKPKAEVRDAPLGQRPPRSARQLDTEALLTRTASSYGLTRTAASSSAKPGSANVALPPLSAPCTPRWPAAEEPSISSWGSCNKFHTAMARGKASMLMRSEIDEEISQECLAQEVLGLMRKETTKKACRSERNRARVWRQRKQRAAAALAKETIAALSPRAFESGADTVRNATRSSRVVSFRLAGLGSSEERTFESPEGEEAEAINEERSRKVSLRMSRVMERRRLQKVQEKKERIQAAAEQHEEEDDIAEVGPEMGQTWQPNDKKVASPSSSAFTIFKVCSYLANEHMVPLVEVKRVYDEFMRLDIDKNGLLSKDEFAQVVREKCMLAPGEEIPAHLLLKQWKSLDGDGSGDVDFKEFFAWQLQTGWKEEMLIPDRGDREFRLFAKEVGVDLPVLENLRALFDSVDADKSGDIDKHEFISLLLKVLKLKDRELLSPQKLARYWREVDFDQDGSISFEEFVKWWLARSVP